MRYPVSFSLKTVLFYLVVESMSFTQKVLENIIAKSYFQHFRCVIVVIAITAVPTGNSVMHFIVCILAHTCLRESIWGLKVSAMEPPRLVKCPLAFSQASERESNPKRALSSTFLPNLSLSLSIPALKISLILPAIALAMANLPLFPSLLNSSAKLLDVRFVSLDKNNICNYLMLE